MAEFFDVITVDEAKIKIKQEMKNITSHIEKIPIINALGRVLGEDIISPVNVPNFMRSTMDGYAVRAKDTFGASEAMPAYLNVAGEILMGQEANVKLKDYECLEISTGGMLPDAADAVVMVEYTEILDDISIGIVKAVAPGENIVNKGEDISKGEILLNQGHLLRPQDIGAIAGIGILEVLVVKKPKVGVISTGDELIPPQEEPKVGQIRDINSYSISALTQEWGGEAILYGIVEDTFEALQDKVSQAVKECDVVVISGGSSVGTRDVTAKVLDSLGKPGVFVHGISVRPGKPTIIASLEGKIAFGLPGHPASAMVVFELLGKPLIEAFLKQNNSWQDKVLATINKNVASSGGREDYVRVQLKKNGSEIIAEPVLGKSGLISTMVKADGIFKIPLDKEGVTSGEEVEVTLF